MREKDSITLTRLHVVIGIGIGILVLLFITNCLLLNTESATSILYAQWLPSANGSSEQRIGNYVWRKSRPPATVLVQDEHPIRQLMQDADTAFERYNADRSKTFKETVKKYRKRYGRHPPPRFKEWYQFARLRQVHNIDDFDQISFDLRPFWSLPPATIRHYAAHASDVQQHTVSTVSLRKGQVFQELWGWRSETFVQMLSEIARSLPDMDIPMNRMDQPRVVVPWEDMQEMLRTEEQTRPSLEAQGVTDGFTTNQSGLWRRKPMPLNSSWLGHWNPFWYSKEHWEDPEDPHPEYGWFWYAGKQYMDLAAKACAPDSYARNPENASRLQEAEASYKLALEQGAFVTNFNLSSDLCTVGPQLSHEHGMLFSPTSILATHKLIPIFGECKVNINNDILFPANMYWKKDKRYEYNDEQDISWDDKDDTMVWRGVTSGGTAFEDKPDDWHNMHRQRLVMMMNGTQLGRNSTSVLAVSHQGTGTYEQQPFQPATFVKEHTDVGFTEKLACLPNCDFYNATFGMLNQTTFAQTFASKYLIDVDGHSFSGRWRAFLQSRSLGLKATIFREWHDSRLFAWRHFAPVDNRFDDLYSLLTYFIGLDRPEVSRHDYEAYTLAKQGRQWAAKVLRREDLEIYLFRLLLEYGRIIDDNRDRIGVVGDGGEEMREFDRLHPAVD